MSNYIRIEGTREQLEGLADVVGLSIRPRTAGMLDSGAWQVFAYGTDAAIAEVQGRGASVSIVRTEAETDTHLATLDDFIGNDSEDEDFA